MNSAAKPTYNVVHKDRMFDVIRSFKDIGEARYFITDCYGPESSNYLIIEKDK